MKRTKIDFAVQVFILLTASSVLIVIGFAAGYEYRSEGSMSDNSFSSWMAAISTVVIAILTFVLAIETMRLRLQNQKQIESLRRESIRPNVNLYLRHNPSVYHYLDLHIVNHGKGNARSISFEFNNLNLNSSGTFEYIVSEIRKVSMLNDGLAILGPEETRITSLLSMSFPDLYKVFGDVLYDCALEVIISFKDDEGFSFSSSTSIHFCEYRNLGQLGGGEPLRRIAKAVEELKKTNESVISGIKRVQVDSFTQDDREERDRQLMERWK